MSHDPTAPPDPLAPAKTMIQQAERFIENNDWSLAADALQQAAIELMAVADKARGDRTDIDPDFDPDTEGLS